MNERQIAIGNIAAEAGTAVATWLPMVILIPFWILMLVLGIKGKIPLANAIASITIITTLLGTLTFGAFGPGVFRKLHESIQEGEIEPLIQTATDELDREYLSLVRDAIRLEIPAAAEESVRNSIEALGEAIDRLPVVISKPLDSEALATEAETLRQQALEESDRVIAESLERRAKAVESRIESHERSAVLARRSEALNAEMLAQIEALRGALFAYQSGGMESAELNRLSESARQVAFESTAVADAQRELDTPLQIVQGRTG